MNPRASVLILAGGGSRRLGQDKGLLEINGRTLLGRVISVGLDLSNDVLVVGRTDLPGDVPRVVSIEDESPGGGPLTGLLTGLRKCENEAVIALACDLPFLDAELLRYLLRCLGEHDAVVPVVEERLQSLHSVYRRRIIPQIEALVAAGGSSLRALLQRLDVCRLEGADLVAAGFDTKSFTNINRPDDWESLFGAESSGIGGKIR